MHLYGLLAILVAVFSVALAAPMPGPTDGSHCNGQPKCQTDDLLFNTSLAAFLKAKKAKNPKGLIWEDDGCSWSPDRPSGYNFIDSCYRHDFGYKNYKKQGRFTEDNRQKIDSNWKDDLFAMCKKQKGAKGHHCRGLATTYFNIVRKVGR